MNHRPLPYRAVALTGLVALLAGCAGNSAITPSGSAGALAGTQAIGHTESQAVRTTSTLAGADTLAGILAGKNFEQVHYSKTNPAGPLPQALMSRIRPHGAGVRATAIHFDRTKIDAKKGLNYIFTSDSGTGDINIYDEATLTLIGQGAGFGGWGVAADKKGHVCWGTSSRTVACGNATAYGWTPTAYLTETVGDAIGLAFTSNGDLYATNFYTNVIDHWSAAQVAGCSSCSPVSTLSVAAVAEAYYLGADGAKLYVDGYDTTYSNAVVGTVNLKTAAFEEILSTSSSTFFPGGIAFDKSHTLIWNDEYGYIFSLAKPYTYVTGYLQYDNGTNPYAYTGIALDSAETDLLAANVYYCSLTVTCSNAQENSYPLGSVGLASATNGDLYDVGIAITPPAKN